jgi:hypothetical protein
MTTIAHVLGGTAPFAVVEGDVLGIDLRHSQVSLAARRLG